MEDEIDLRPYVAALLNYWYLLLITGIGTAVIVFLLASTTPPQYAATSIVVVIHAQETIEFDARFREVAASQPIRGYPQLALSDQVLQLLLDEQPLPSIRTAADLRKLLSAESGDDVSIIRLTAVATQPADAAILANLWASLFAEWANGLFNMQNGEQLSYFQARLADAQTDLAEADTAVVANETINRSQTISNTLAVYNQTQFDLLARQQDVQRLQSNIQHLQTQLSAGHSATVADQITLLALQLRIFEADTAVPQLQIDLSNLQAALPAAQTAVLQSWSTILTNQATQLTEELAQLEPRILALQEERQRLVNQTEQLLLQKMIASETYLALARKVEQERIAIEDTTTGVVVASQAAIPLEAESRGRLLFTAVGGFAGVALASVAIIGHAWYRTNITRTSRPKA